ncbi:MAG: hypothetical protein ACKPE3_15500 [Sphaerospermopsis kisseleviana]
MNQLSLNINFEEKSIKEAGAMALLISLHPRHSKNIFAGKKIIELRKREPRQVDRVLVYETLPTAAIVGWFDGSGVLAYKQTHWIKKQEELQLTEQEIKDYLGHKTGFGIVVWQPQLIAPIPLSKMREVGILPPQGYRYLSGTDLEKLGAA